MSASRLSRLVLVVLLTTLLFALAVWFIYQLQTIVVWTILALFLAIGLCPSVDWLHRHRLPRALAILLVYLVLIVALAAIAAVVEPVLAQQVTQLLQVLQQPRGVSVALDRIVGPVGLSGLVASVGPQIDAIPGELAGSLGSVTSVTVATFGTITGALSVAVLGFFFLHDGREMVRRATDLISVRHQPAARRVLEHSARAIDGYIRGNLAISVIAGVSVYVGMRILGIPYALPLAILLAILDLIPMVGAQLGAVPVVLAALMISPLKAVIILAYIIVYSQIESNVLNPLIYGRNDQLPGLVVFLAFLAGSLLFGILGALIAIPAANIIRVLVREWMAYRQANGTMDLPDAKSAPSHIPWTRDQVEALD
jgi:predicted PurR-regulated permease PerM